jgi:hypothetical protein
MKQKEYEIRSQEILIFREERITPKRHGSGAHAPYSHGCLISPSEFL